MKHRAQRGLLLVAIAVLVAVGVAVAWQWAPASSAAETGPRTMIVVTEPTGQPFQPPGPSGEPLARETRPAAEAVTATEADGIQASRE